MSEKHTKKRTKTPKHTPKNDIFEVKQGHSTHKKPTSAKKSAGKAHHASKAKKRTRAAKKAYCWWAMPAILLSLIIIGCAALVGVKEIGNYENFCFMKASVENQCFYNGVIIENYDVSGRSLSDMLSYWENVVEKPYREASIVFETDSGSFCVTAEELGYTSNYESVLRSAWNSGRSGTLEERYRFVNSVETDNSVYSVSRTLYNPQLLWDITEETARMLTKEGSDAQVESFDFDTKEFTFTEEVSGTYVDGDKLFVQACEVLSNGGGVIKIEVEEVAPSVTVADLEGNFGMITQAVTNASSSSKNRMTNVKLACEAINGTVVMPGETFSFNDTVGRRTAEKGYKVATVYSSGEVSEDIGGGVCQVSTTLWNAAMKANCEIVERHNHSRPVSYVDKGKDATVSYGSQDMKFKNTSDYPMYIVGYVSSSGRVYFEIYGKMFPNGRYIKIVAQTTEKISPGATQYVYNPAMAEGARTTVTEARTGYKAVAYRVYYEADGTEIKRELLCSSYYKEAAAVVEYG